MNNMIGSPQIGRFFSVVKHQCRLFSVIMQDVESYGIVSAEKKSTMLKDRIIAYLAVLLTLLSFIFSCIGLNMGRQSSLEKTLYTFSLLQSGPQGRDWNGCVA